MLKRWVHSPKIRLKIDKSPYRLAISSLPPLVSPPGQVSHSTRRERSHESLSNRKSVICLTLHCLLRTQTRAAMTLTRRNVGTSEPGRGRSSSMWEEEADAYWQRMEPGRKSKAFMRSVGVLVLALVVCSAAFTSWNALREIEFASLSSRLLAKLRPSDVTSNATTVSAPSATVTNMELLRSRCRVRGVQTRWHEETCRKLCAR